MKTNTISEVLSTSREYLASKQEYLAGTTAQPHVAHTFEVASEQTDDLEEVGLYLFGVQQNKKIA